MRAKIGYRVPNPPFGRATLLSSTHTVSVKMGSFGLRAFRAVMRKLAFAAPHPDDRTALRESPEFASTAL